MNYFLLSSSNRVSFTITTKHNNTQHCKHNSLIKMRVIVVGGGIGGLTVANCLKKCGIEVAVYERAPKLLPEVGSGIGIWHPALLVMREIGIEDQILNKGRIMQSAGYKSTRGHWLATPSPDFHTSENRVASLRRGDVIDALVKALPPDTIHTNHTFKHFIQKDNKVQVVFEDGLVNEADLLIGADGMHSKIRKQLFGDITPKYCGYTTYRAILNSPFPENEVSFETWGPGRRFAAVPLKGESLFWYAAVEGPPTKEYPITGKKETILKELAGWHSPIAEILNATEEKQILQTDIYETPKMEKWASGRVVLMGDAVHATAPTLAQGACLAMEDSAELAHLLSTKPLNEELWRTYENNRKFRARVVQNMSRWIAAIGQTHLLREPRDLIMRMTPTSIMTPCFNTVLRFCLGWNYSPPKLGR